MIGRQKLEKMREEKKKSDAAPEMVYPKQENFKEMPKRKRDDNITMTEEDMKECKHN